MKTRLQKIGKQLFIGFPGTEVGAGLKDLIRTVAPGGIVLFKRNVASREQLQQLLEEAQALAREHLGRPLWVAVDQEGGPVQRLQNLFAPLPSARDLALEGPAAIERHAGIAAEQLVSLGIHINYAPVLDLGTEPGVGFLKDRCLAADPGQVAALASVWIRALQDRTISATAKHFPGLGLAALDPHHHLPVLAATSKTELEPHLLPFQAVIDRGVHAVMSSHAVYAFWNPAHPATLAPEVGRDLLRDRLGFSGVYFSDDLDMAAIRRRYSDDEVVRRGLEASLDAFLLCQDPDHCEPFFRALVDTVTCSGQFAARHREAVQRLDRTLGFHHR